MVKPQCIPWEEFRRRPSLVSTSESTRIEAPVVSATGQEVLVHLLVEPFQDARWPRLWFFGLRVQIERLDGDVTIDQIRASAQQQARELSNQLHQISPWAFPYSAMHVHPTLEHWVVSLMTKQ